MAIVLLAIILLIALLLAVELTHLSRLAPQFSDPIQLQTELAQVNRYAPMTRLFAREDFDFLASHRNFSKQIQRRFSQRRKKVMALYLREIRRDFHRVCALCRLLAPLSGDAEFGTSLARQTATFYGLYVSLWLRLMVSPEKATLVSRVNDLDRVLGSLRDSAQQLVRTAGAEA